MKAHLSSAAASDLQGRSIIEIPFKAGSVQPISPANCVSVLFIPKTGKDGSTADGVWLLGVRPEKDVDWVAVAIPSTELAHLGAAISASEPMIAVPLSSPAVCNFTFVSR